MIDKVFDSNAVVLYTGCDDGYVPYLLVLLASIIGNSSEKTNYDIIILEMSMSVENKKRLKEMADGYSNISVRVFSLYRELKLDNQFWKVGKWVQEMYVSILGMYALKHYDKAIYMDCDVICLRDIQELYRIDLGGALVGAVKLLARCILKNNVVFHSLKVKNWRKEFDIEFDYYNNGVMLQNMKTFREIYSLNYILDFIGSQDYELLDQDIINYLTRNRVVWIDAAWNSYPYIGEQFYNMIGMIPEAEREYWVKGYENWACIHYTIPVKPWLETKGSYSYGGRFFWQYAASLGEKDFSFFVKKALLYDENKKYLAEIIERDYDDLEKTRQNKKLLVYGYGFRGKQLYQSGKFDIAGFIDMDGTKRGTELAVPVGGFELIDDPEKCVVLISNDQWDIIALGLKERGLKSVFSLCCLEKRDVISWYPRREDYYSISLCFGLLSDGKSKKLLDSLISKRNSRIMDRTVKYSDIYEDDQYFRKDIFTVTPEEIYVDVGSYNGCTIDGFMGYTQNRYKKIYGFELDRANYEMLCENIQGENIVLQNIAVTDHWGVGHYSKNGYYSYLTENEKETVQVNTLDNLIVERPTFIKINVGNTKEVVCGATGILTNYKPKLAIVLSYCYSDLWEIPLLVHSINPEYKLYIRHHSIDFSGTVLYAV